MLLWKETPEVHPLRAIQIEFARMTALVETQLADAIGAFERRDVDAAERIVPADRRIDKAQASVDQLVMECLRRGQLAEHELREAVSLLKVASDLERIGDLAKNVAKRTLVVSREKPIASISGVARMGRSSLRQFSDALDAFSQRNLARAEAVWGGDDDLDELYNSVFREILEEMMGDPKQVNAGAHLVFIAKNFERVGDHATNIAETLHFLQTGTVIGEERPKGDETSMTAVSRLKE